MSKKPSNFTSYPWNSTLAKCEAETIAQNIMKILKRTGDVFRELSYEEYEAERKKDGHYSLMERGYFEQVIPYCCSADNAARFSPEWRKV